MILFIKHIDIEGPGTLGDFCREQGLDLKEIDLSKKEWLPEDLTGLDAVGSLGGPMNVYETDKFPFLAAEDVFLKKIMQAGIPLLGICLGARLFAKAAGAPIKKSPAREVGFNEVFLTDKGLGDPLITGFENKMNVFQWHEDTFDIPAGGELLAVGKDCFHQAFRIGRCAYGIQFHVEVTHVDIDMWARAYLNARAPQFDSQTERMLDDYFDNESLFRKQAFKLYENFLGICRARIAV